jgi:Arc/MetJ family transcription regulator
VGFEALRASSNDDKTGAFPEKNRMRTTLALDDDLVARAQTLTGLKEKSRLVREALKALIERESGNQPRRRSARPCHGDNRNPQT